MKTAFSNCDYFGQPFGTLTRPQKVSRIHFFSNPPSTYFSLTLVCEQPLKQSNNAVGTGRGIQPKSFYISHAGSETLPQK